ncbi:18367_t:CDS:2, partial [Gigaspora rosea]
MSVHLHLNNELPKTWCIKCKLIIDSINCPNKDDIPEYEHTMRNVIPFIDAVIRDKPDFTVQYTLNATATRRNFDRDHLERSRIGYKVDVLFKFCGLHWTPEIGSGEISGGLLRCTIAKEWMDTIKLGWELRD